MDLQQASELSSEIVEILKPHCKQIMVCGSIRREKPICRDIDIVLIPGNQGALAVALEGLGEKMKGGPKMIQRRYKGVQIDLYIADKKTWPTLVLIRTGSKEFNRSLCLRARSMSMKLHADGSGIESLGIRVHPTTEADVFKMLGLPYVKPPKRG